MEAPSRNNVVSGTAIDYGVRAAGVVSKHTTEHGPIGRRSFGPKEKTVGLEEGV